MQGFNPNNQTPSQNNSTTPQNKLDTQFNENSYSQSSILKSSTTKNVVKRGQPTINIETAEEQEMSMQKRLMQQQQLKNSTRSNGVDSPQCQDSVSHSIDKGNKKRNVRKIMNDSLNMINKSRNKYLNKSFQQNNTSSSATRLGQVSIGGDTNLGNSINQHMSLRKIAQNRQGAETSMKKLNSTASYDILGIQRDTDQFDQSYGHLAPEIFNRNGAKSGMRSPHSFAKNWTNQNTNTLNSNVLVQSSISGGSNSINIVQSQISNKNVESNQKLSSERDQLEVRNSSNISSQYTGGNKNNNNMQTTQKKHTFKFNFKSSAGQSSGMINTPLARSFYQQTNNNGGMDYSKDQINSNSDIFLNESSYINKPDYPIQTEVSSRVSPLSQMPKKQLIFNTKGQVQQMNTNQNDNNHGERVSTQQSTQISSIKFSSQQEQIQSRMNNKSQLLKQYSSQKGVQQQSHNPEIISNQQQQLIGIQTGHNQPFNSNKENSSPMDRNKQMVRPFEYTTNQDEQLQNRHVQKNPMLQNLDSSDFIDHNQFYQQQAQHSTTSLHSQSMSQEVNSKMVRLTKNLFRVPKISKMQMNMYNPNNQSQQQFLSMGENSDFSQEPTIKRSLTPSSGYYSISQLNVNQSGKTEKYQQKRKQTNHNFHQLFMIDQQFQNDSVLQISNGKHQQPSSGEDISFNIDCSQAFQLNNQTLERPVTVGEISSALKMRDLLGDSIDNIQVQTIPKDTKKMITQSTTIGSRKLKTINNAQGHINVDSLASNKIEDSMQDSENLETSRFSSTLESQIQQNTLILTNQSNQNNTIQSQDYSQSQRFLKVAPNAHQIKTAVMNQVNHRNNQNCNIPQSNQTVINKQYFSKLKSDRKNHGGDQARSYLLQLKQEIENRRDQQIMRNEQLFQDQQQLAQNLSSILHQSSLNNSSMINQNQISNNNIFIISSSNPSRQVSSQKKKRTGEKQQFIRQIHPQNLQKRDLSADNLAFKRNDHEQCEESCCLSCSCFNTSRLDCDQNDREQSESQESSSFIESSQQEECKDCLDSKCQSRLCCNHNESERQSKLSKKQRHNDGNCQNKMIKQDQDGRIKIKYKDQASNQVYTIQAPNNVLFNDNLNLAEENMQRGRLPRMIQRVNDQDQSQNLIPVVKRNLTPDDHLRKEQAESYILVDQKGKPKKIYIQRNVPIKVHSPNSRDINKNQSKTLDYDNQSQDSFNNQQFLTIQQPTKTKTNQVIKSQRKKFMNEADGDSSLICCLSTKSQKDYKYQNGNNQRSGNGGGGCILQ
ncbi:UNKNOWN [Stylonychia lemnae]|uniref:Uncharacterized protein n=1 Tax=Stylonychia lemnae TaxID=5949 RepID=A0A078AU50_STYLE|nr:UNKNOWN [Stylonychia lemnae]|eukprot:CDW85930.1 UNKNOWN [Stylonychia lemnae]